MMPLPPNIEIFYTGDGSPTLVFSRADGYVEKMHHAQGALSESIYIYHHAVMQILLTDNPPQILSLGLGMGYNEFLTMAEFYRAGVSNYKVWSFENIPALREGFRSWIKNDPLTELTKVVDQVARMVCTHFSIPLEILRTFMLEGLNDGRLQLRGSFPEDSQNVQANVVFYDAYSRKMDEALWAEDNLVSSMENVLLPECMFASYAANGSLNRSLRRLGFRPKKMPGFKGKRESTMAFRSQVR